MNVPKILIVGKIRAGKSSVTDHLRFEHGFDEIAFGSMLKYYAHKVFTHSDVVGGGDKPARKPRALYQQFGELCRQIDPMVWIQHAEFELGMKLDSRATKGVVISDGRQPHELDWARANGFTIVRVTAPDELRVARAKEAGDQFDAKDLAHDTEQHVAGFAVDYEIVNDGTIDELYAKVDALMSEIRGGDVNGRLC
ncbi:AAA family ATPase [Heyndrickxia sporothermodurans]|uniref:deoxynucleotide monophosphate kinase family protein n=1 Tax=Heyndrickxia sporothermodurans TaxID=46224 RepID=UPI002E22DECF|nr:AAA family ATPase [Heyndrickxia sporothermodurans]MED3697958.1 AAA family ATPase [Heyndrickxia sporothermodurans]